MKTIDLDKADAPLIEYAHDASEEPVVLMVEGRPYAAIVGFDETSMRNLLHIFVDEQEREEREFDAEIESLSNNPKFVALVEDALTSLKTEGGFTREEIRREFGLD
jgi:hypothetical protein